MAVRELGARIVLSGAEEQLRTLLSAKGGDGLPIDIVNATQVIGMDEHPANAVRQKPELLDGCRHEGGARRPRPGLCVGGQYRRRSWQLLRLFELRRIKGVSPALAAMLPTRKGGTLVIDVGANADSKPEYLAQFGLMGSVYMQHVLACSGRESGSSRTVRRSRRAARWCSRRSRGCGRSPSSSSATSKATPFRRMRLTWWSATVSPGTSSSSSRRVWPAPSRA